MTLAKHTLRPGDVEMFQRFGVDAEFLTRVGVRRVTHDEAREELGIRYRSDHLEGLAFPYYDPTSGELLTYRLRRDHPELEAGRPVAKYIEPPDRHRLFFVPGAAPLLADTSITVVIVEAEKSALTVTAAAARTARPLLAIAAGGAWGWKGIIGKTADANGARVNEKGPLPDLDRITWTHRDVVIVFDANAATNGSVQAARKQLAAELTRRGALVRVAEIPTEAGVNGPDDYRAGHSDAALLALIDTARAPSAPKAKPSKEKPTPGRAVHLEQPEPWPDPVDGASLLEQLTALFAKYLALPIHADVALALWVLHAYTIDACFVSPMLAVTSPVMRCGKTKCLILLGALTPRRIFASSITAAGLFRTVEKFQPTLIIDEADTFLRDHDDLRGLLNSGHTRTTAVAIRPVGDDHEPRAFSTWCAKAVALIGKLPGTLADRAIEVPMRRRTPNEPVARLRQDAIDDEGATLRRQAARWAADHLEVLQQADPDVPNSLHDRAADCWRPLIAIADVIDPDWAARARVAATTLSATGLDDAEIGVELLKDIQTIFMEEVDFVEDGAFKTSVLLTQLHAMEDRPWPAFGKSEKPLTSHKLAQLLKRFGIVSAGRLEFKSGRVRGYRVDAFEEAFRRYSPLKVSDRPKPNNDGPEVPFSKCPETPVGDTSKMHVSPINTGSRDDRTLQRGGNGGIHPSDDEEGEAW